MLIETAREFTQVKCCYLSWNLAWTISSVVGEWWFLVTRNLNFKSPPKRVSQTLGLFPRLGLLGRGCSWPVWVRLMPGSGRAPRQRWGSSSAAEAVSFYSNFILSINIFQTFWRDEASRVSHFSLHMTDGGPGPQLAYTGCPSELVAPQLVIYIGCDAPECTAEQRLSNRNRLTGAWLSSRGCLLHLSLPLHWWNTLEKQLSSVSLAGKKLPCTGELQCKAWGPVEEGSG